MIALYNICQLIILLLTWPALVLLVLSVSKYRQGVGSRLGFGLQRLLHPALTGQKTVWIHALSVGEVSSAHPLVTGLRREFPGIRIIFSASTRTGLKMAGDNLASLVDSVIPSPLDLQPVATRYVRLIRPDLFILVETDFWPNLLHTLRRKGIPAILVNGRISQKSLSSYTRFAFFFRPLFQSFSVLCMQTESDRNDMVRFGVNPASLHCPGNLKYDMAIGRQVSVPDELSSRIPPQHLVFLAGSTHEGEEDIILSAYSLLKKKVGNLFLIIAPRNPQRRMEVSRIAANHNLSWSYRTDSPPQHADLLIIDTMGELPQLYPFAAVAFVGGSLVNEGGHNPIEPAGAGVPVLFGPHMEDFSEISRDLLQAGAAVKISSQTSLQQALETLLLSDEQRKKMSEAAIACISRQRGVVDRHLKIIREYL